MTLRTSITVRAAIALLALGVVATGLALAGCGSTKAVATPTGRASGKPGQGGGDPTSMVTSRLAALVTKGTITSAQESAIATALSKGTQGAGGQPPSGGQAPSTG